MNEEDTIFSVEDLKEKGCHLSFDRCNEKMAS